MRSIVIVLSTIMLIASLAGCSNFWQNQRDITAARERFYTSECTLVGTRIAQDCDDVRVKNAYMKPGSLRTRDH